MQLENLTIKISRYKSCHTTQNIDVNIDLQHAGKYSPIWQPLKNLTRKDNITIVRL
jgi:hypothetical protein